MRTETLSADNPQTIHRAIEVLAGGGIVAFPTDTVYGIGALAFDNNAVTSIYAAKDRPVEKAIPILIAEIMDLAKVAAEVSHLTRRLASRFWPGPLTCIVPKLHTLPESVSATETVGVRIPDHGTARILLRLAGPMAVTSANISGQPAPITAEEVYHQLDGRIPLIIDGGKTPGGIPSTLVDCTDDKLKILREGPITLEEIKKKLSSRY
jgi:L-threonylcarbamoyladenylate synthase